MFDAMTYSAGSRWRIARTNGLGAKMCRIPGVSFASTERGHEYMIDLLHIDFK